MMSFNGSGKSPRGFTGTVPSDGARTATVPGLVRALEDAHERYGRLPRERLTANAARLARDGFPASESLLAAVQRQHARIEPTGWTPLDEPLELGKPIRQPELADALDGIASGGATALYDGHIAAALVEVAQADGSALDEKDLSTHETVVAEPISVAFRGARVHGQPPVSQAVLGLMALGYLDAFETGHPAARVHSAIEAVEAAFAHRDRVADEVAGKSLMDERLQVDRFRAQRRGGPTTQTHTTAIATADVDGIVVSMVISVFDEFGCAVLVPDGGFFLNNRMMGFSADPESPNGAAPGKRPVHTLSPMLVETPASAFAVSTPGADGQVQTLTQIIDGMLGEGIDATAALDRRRWRSSDSRVMLEDGFDPEVARWLEAAGHDIHWSPAGDRPFGAAVIAGKDIRHCTVFAAADLRRDAWAAAC